MKADGRLYHLNGTPANSRSGSRTKINIDANGVEVITNDNNDDDNYRYNNGQPMNKTDSLRMKLENEKQRLRDSLQKAREKIDQQLEKVSDNNESTSPLSSELPVLSPMMNID
jgi:hypothetical protein